MAEYPVMSTSQGTYGRIEQTSYVIHTKYAERGARGLRLGNTALEVPNILHVCL